MRRRRESKYGLDDSLWIVSQQSSSQFGIDNVDIGHCKISGVLWILERYANHLTTTIDVKLNET